MRSYVLREGSTSLEDLAMVERDVPRPAPAEVLVRVRACSLNFRDQSILAGKYFGGKVPQDQVPLSDGAGEVVEVGEGVTRFAAGDRVASSFFLNWTEGPPRPDAGPALGAPPAPGMLAEYVALPERAVVPIADNLSFEEAATLPCAGVTAWNGLVLGAAPLHPGQDVLLLGTGGVSILALQIAVAGGANIVITSSSDDKLARAEQLGAKQLVNYRQIEEWGREAYGRFGRAGVGKVIEVGGFGTLPQSMQAVGWGGEIAMIGVMTRGGDTAPHPLMVKGASLRGIMVGSRAMAIDLNRAIEAADIHPVIDKVFPFEEAAEAYRYQASPHLFAKVVIAV
ncbi:NAD(P)-dependent alcohol dehydrogenase [Sphingosinicella sp. CPCC 101087]|uniref:zinc-dependent alcohol dehydrogenase family protein n=1 Tax=Sphingosinicella sp. CPCC 101087 TaxID=2497754 RepID=UPI00101D050C|nr:NAD(P)-dependent alcohol dehydrogenase [Sphingosinicella sp. CPCC 101087]